jgi:hypothetical protein
MEFVAGNRSLHGEFSCYGPMRVFAVWFCLRYLGIEIDIGENAPARAPSPPGTLNMKK